MSNIWDKVIEWSNKIVDPDPCTKYAIEVCCKKSFLTSQYVEYMCRIHLLYLYKEAHDPDFPFTFKKKPLSALIAFSKNIIVPEINGPFIFPEFRKFQAGYIFGWRHKSDPQRLVVREVFEIAARKQWKSSFYAMISLAILCGLTGDNFPEIYVAGPQLETSKIPFKTAVNYLIKSPKVQPFFKTYNTLHIKSKQGGIMKHLPFEKASLEGKNPSLIILTEYHLHKDDAMQESAITARNLSRKNQLIIYDTTKGHNLDSVCFHREQSYKKIIQDIIDNPHTMSPNFDIFLWCAELDKEDYSNWEDPNLWIKANPNMGVSVSMDQLLSEFHKLDSYRAEVEFKSKRLGMWVNEATAAFSLADIINSDTDATLAIKDYLNDVEKLKKCAPVIGIDLSNIYDTTAAVIGFEIPQPDGEPVWLFMGKCYIPEDKANEKEFGDRTAYHEYRDSGWMDFTPGGVLDYDYLVSDVTNWKKQYKNVTIGYDPWNFYMVKKIFLNSNIFLKDEITPVQQGVKLSPYIKEFERKMKLRKISFAGNKLFMEHLKNVAFKEVGKGASENLLMEKVSQTRRIDAVAAMLNIVAQRADIQPNAGDVGFRSLNLGGK